MIKVPRLKLNRHGVFCIRVIYKDEHGKRRETLQSLNTKDPGVARVLALHFNLNHELKRSEAMNYKNNASIEELAKRLKGSASNQTYTIDLQQGVYKADGEDDHRRMMEALAIINQRSQQVTTAQTLPVVQKSKKISEVISLYSQEKLKDNNQNTIKDKNRTYQSLMDLFGDIEINLFSKQELVSWKSTQLKQDIKATTINSKIGELNGLFEYALNNGFYTVSDKNPCEGLKIGKASKLKATYESYEPFTNDELKAIFNHQTYSKRLSKPDQYIIPLMALLTGARREELASLKTQNIKEIDGVWSIEIEAGKNENARRIVPIHSKLIELGLLDYAKSIKEKEQFYLFPYLVDGANGRGKNVGRQFSILLRDDLKIINKRKVFHSFRHSFITRLHTINSNKAHVIQLVGHEDDSVHFGTYTHDVGLKALQDTVNRLNYDIDFYSLKFPLKEFDLFISRWKKQDERRLRRLINKSFK